MATGLTLFGDLKIIGHDGIGKTSLALTLTEGAFPTHDVEPTAAPSAIEFADCRLGIWDVDSSRLDLRLSTLGYQTTRIFLCCYDVSSQESLQHLIDVKLPEITKHNSPVNAPIILCGLKSDIGDGSVTTADVKAAQSALNARRAVVCSALTGDGLEDLKGTIYGTIKDIERGPGSGLPCVVM